KKIPASLWYLGLQRLGEGRFGLALLHPTKVRPLGATAGSTATLKPDLVVPLQLEHNPTAHPELRITLRPDSKKPNGIVLAVCWGSHRLSVALEATLALDKTVDPTFRVPLERELTTTASGLKYRELEPGVGPLPAAGSRFTTNYTLWLTSGKKIDTSIGRGPFQFKDGVIPGWLEGIKLMKPGAKFLFVIPPELAYGDRHTGPIPAGSTLVFWVHLLRVDPK
ncbi:MAG: FKBP-type peptidyl-prolyl cis-trans isomerase, partial [Planctomycetes bacterium]|nr:FKBP-type peptidyl-prolyl cis-trans isomerase [Planctomycetota bacterium]